MIWTWTLQAQDKLMGWDFWDGIEAKIPITNLLNRRNL
jgi:hypothetical protein